MAGTLLAATSREERDMWVTAIAEAIKTVNSAPVASSVPQFVAPIGTPSKSPQGAPPMMTPRGAKVGTDTGAGSIQANGSLNVEQLKALEPDVLVTLRIKQLKVRKASNRRVVPLVSLSLSYLTSLATWPLVPRPLSKIACFCLL
eukprot:121740-Prymnesium_polylepis.1